MKNQMKTSAVIFAFIVFVIAFFMKFAFSSLITPLWGLRLEILLIGSLIVLLTTTISLDQPTIKIQGKHTIVGKLVKRLGYSFFSRLDFFCFEDFNINSNSSF